MSSAVLVTRALPESVLARLEGKCELFVHRGPGAMGREELLERARGCAALVCLLTDRVDAELLDAAGPGLRIVANVAVGYDNIDFEVCRARGVVVTNTPDVLTNACADFTWGLILAITRRLGEGERLLRAGGWQGWGLDFMLGSELRTKRLGLVGMGRIGRAVAAKAPVFGMTVAHTSRSNAAVKGSTALSLEALLESSDVVSLHCPLTTETRHLIDAASFERMKRSAYLINTSRGPVVDEAALARALEDHAIAGAALDVYEDEPRVHPELVALDNVLLVPHLASATVETRTAMADLAVSNVLAVLGGEPPLTPVNAQSG
jgi:glyoxylate reductase